MAPNGGVSRPPLLPLQKCADLASHFSLHSTQ
jgi:hypothetical protein